MALASLRDGSGSPEAAAALSTLRSLQDEHDVLFKAFSEERRALEEKYAERFGPLYVKRSEELSKGALPHFWLTAFANCEVLNENITDKDAAALRYLRDVIVKDVTAAEAAASPKSKKLTAGTFTLTFKFAENPFFENDELTKTYVMEQDDDSELDRAVGCPVKWKPGKDLTHRILKKKIRGGRGGAGKVITKKEPCDSFFNFFSPPEPPSEDKEFDEDELEAIEEVVGLDFELGETIRSDVVARAVLYFADEVENDEDENEDEDEDEDAEDSSDRIHDEKDIRGPDEDGTGGQNPGPPPTPEECKQQ